MPPRASALRRLNGTSGAGGASALVSAPAQEHFWQAVNETEVFVSPLGAPAAVVPVGTVVKEAATYVDPFDDVWIATVDADGETVWLRELEDQGIDGSVDDRDEDWVRVVAADQGGAAAPPPAAASQAKVKEIPVSNNGGEVKLFEYFWGFVHGEGHRDWNQEYQHAVEDVMYGEAKGGDEVGAEMNALRERLQNIVQEFAAHVGESVTTIVTQMFASGRNGGSRVVKHPSEAGVYYLNGTLFRIAIDTAGKCGGDDGAMKVASQHAKNLQQFAHTAPRYMLAVPMSLSMAFCGYRVQACSIPPVGASASILKATERSFLGAMMRAVGSELNLSPIIVNWSIALSPSSIIVAGKDCRLYLFGLEDASPPFAPPMKRASYNPAITSRLWRLRKEVVEQCPSPISTAAFQKGFSDKAADEVVEYMTRWVKCVGLQTCAAVMGLMEPCTVSGMEGIACSGCGKAVEDEVRFAVCHNDCCHICAQCNINAYEAMAVKKDSKACEELLKGFVKCDGGRARNIRALKLSPDVTSIMHHHGVNLRLLHAVYGLLPSSAKSLMGIHLEVEMVARAAKTVLFRRLRRGATCVEDIGSICANFFMALMQPEGELAEAFWAQELGPAIQELFDVFVPFDTEALDIECVCERVSELTGVNLTTESLASFRRLQAGADDGVSAGASAAVKEGGHVPTPPRKAKPGNVAKDAPAQEGSTTTVPALSETTVDGVGSEAFIQIASINPTMKNVSIPMFCDAPGGRRDFLKDHLSALLLLWAGEMDGRKEEFLRFEASHPKYLSSEQQ